MIATSLESIFIPSIGLSLDAGVPAEVTDQQAQALANHPLITLSPGGVAQEAPSSSVAQIPEPETTQEVNNG